MIRVKVCGITNLAELETIEKSGADAVGFLVGQKHNAVGFITPNEAKELVQQASPFIDTIMVTHIEDIDEIIKLANEINPDVIQLHSNLSSKTIENIKEKIPHIKLIGKVSIIDDSAVTRALEIDSVVDAILLDSIDIANDRVGGTGLTHNWEISAQIVKAVSSPVILAGGLTPDNVQRAIQKVKPWGVDANSKLNSNGVKDPLIVNAFVQNTKQII